MMASLSKLWTVDRRCCSMFPGWPGHFPDDAHNSTALIKIWASALKLVWGVDSSQGQCIQGCRKIQEEQENLSDNLSAVKQFGFEEYAKSVLLSNCWTAIFSIGWTVMCPSV